MPPWEEEVMVLMMKQSQCLNLDRSKENVPIPAGRAAPPHMELCHEHIPKGECDSRAGKASRAPGCAAAVGKECCVFGLSLLAQPQLPDVPAQLPAAVEVEVGFGKGELKSQTPSTPLQSSVNFGIS